MGCIATDAAERLVKERVDPIVNAAVTTVGLAVVAVAVELIDCSGQIGW